MFGYLAFKRSVKGYLSETGVIGTEDKDPKGQQKTYQEWLKMSAARLGKLEIKETELKSVKQKSRVSRIADVLASIPQVKKEIPIVKERVYRPITPLPDDETRTLSIAIGSSTGHLLEDERNQTQNVYYQADGERDVFKHTPKTNPTQWSRLSQEKRRKGGRNRVTGSDSD